MTTETYESFERTVEELADAEDLRAVIEKALGENPPDEQMLRRGVWSYVNLERHAGTSPGRVIVRLTTMVEDAGLEPLAVRHSLLRRVILWCVEAYFGHLGGDVVGRDRAALSDTSDATGSTI